MKNLALAKLQALSLAKTLPHAWVFVGAQADTLKFAEEYSQWLLCLNKQDHLACGACKSCNLFSAQTHPDVYRVTPQVDKHTIQIDSVRMVSEFTAVKPQLSAQKIVLLYPAEDMPRQSANALLKSLEEPCSDTIYILLTKHRELLLKTIVSRCQLLNFTDYNRLLSKLAVESKVLGDAERRTGVYTLVHEDSSTASTTQFAATVEFGKKSNRNTDQMYTIPKQMSKDLVQLWVQKSMTTSQLVETWIKQWPQEVLYWFDVVLTDIIRFKYTQENDPAKSWNVEQTLLSTALKPSKLWTILERLRQAQYWLGQNQNPNLQLMLEDMLLI